MTTPDRTVVYVGTHVSSVESSRAQGADGGIYVCELDPATGRLTQLQQVAADCPSALTVSASRGMVYAACRGIEYEQHGVGAVLSFSIDPESGKLTPVDDVRVPAHPAYISLDRTESFALVVCAFAGSVAVVPLGDRGALDRPSSVVVHADGPSLMSQGITSATLGTRRWSSDSVLPHSIEAAPDNRFVLVPDVGLNRIAVYRFDARTGQLTSNSPPWVEGAPIAADLPTHNPAIWATPRGAGPRHMCFNETGDRVYVANETSSTVSTFTYDAEHGTLERVQDISTLPTGWATFNSAADVHLHPSGRHLYVTNRGHDSIAIMSVDPGHGRLELVGHSPVGGNRPRSFTPSPDGEWLLIANVSSNSINVSRVDPRSGLLELTGDTTSIPAPTCVKTLRVSTLR